MTEAQFRSKLLKILKPFGWFYHPGDKYHAGIPDILGVYNGNFIAIECKIDTNKLTLIQHHYLKDINYHGGKTFAVRYVNKQKSFRIDHDNNSYVSFVTLNQLAMYILQTTL